jgi:hypothetical protein
MDKHFAVNALMTEMISTLVVFMNHLAVPPFLLMTINQRFEEFKGNAKKLREQDFV